MRIISIVLLVLIIILLFYICVQLRQANLLKQVSINNYTETEMSKSVLGNIKEVTKDTFAEMKSSFSQFTSGNKLEAFTG